MVGLLGEVPILFVSWGKSRYCLFPGGSPDIVCFMGEVPILFVSWGNSREGFVARGSPDIVWLLGEFPRCDVTPHIG